jgi:hypothetical protein
MLSVQAPVQQPPSTETSRVVDTRPTVLITEQEVKLLTAAAIATAPAKQGPFARWIAANRAARAARAAQPSRRRYTAHYEFLEHAAMARAMERL